MRGAPGRLGLRGRGAAAGARRAAPRCAAGAPVCGPAPACDPRRRPRGTDRGGVGEGTAGRPSREGRGRVRQAARRIGRRPRRTGRLPRRHRPGTVPGRGPSGPAGRDRPRPPLRQDDEMGRLGAAFSAARPVDLCPPRCRGAGRTRHDDVGASLHARRGRAAVRRGLCQDATGRRRGARRRRTRAVDSGGARRAGRVERSSRQARSSTSSRRSPSSRAPSTSASCPCRDASS